MTIHSLTPIVIWIASVLAQGAWFQIPPDQPDKPRHTEKKTLPRSPERLKVLTFNILHGQLGLDPIAELIGKQHPDIVFLQEVRRPAGATIHIDQATYIAKRLGGLHVVSATSLGEPNKPTWDPAILSRFELQDARLIRRKHSGRVFAMLATLKDSEPPLHLVSVHTRSTHRLTMDHVVASSMVRMEQVTALLQLVKNLDGDVIIGGDFNAADWMPEYLALSRQWTDFGRVTNDKKWSYPAENPKVRIDYVFGRGSFEAISYRVLDVRLSDHRPVVAVVQRRRPKHDSMNVKKINRKK